MAKRYSTLKFNWIERNRFQLLLLCTVLLLVLPAFAGSGRLYQLIFVITLSFVFVQSMVVAQFRKSRKRWVRIVVLVMILVMLLKPIGIESVYLEFLKLSFMVIFFTVVILHLTRFISKSTSVNMNVLITSINIYLLAGIVGASLTMACYQIFPEAYNFPVYIVNPQFVHFLYYSFITMSTVGYGDIIPRVPETQTLAYLLSVTGQLYVAIIIAFLIGKYLMQGDHQKEVQSKFSNKNI